jgi:hypothetical protein
VPLLWVVIGLLLAWIVISLLVVVLCRSTGRIDQGLGERRPRPFDPPERKPPPRRATKVE